MSDNERMIAIVRGDVIEHEGLDTEIDMECVKRIVKYYELCDFGASDLASESVATSEVYSKYYMLKLLTGEGYIVLSEAAC